MTQMNIASMRKLNTIIQYTSYLSKQYIVYHAHLITSQGLWCFQSLSSGAYIREGLLIIHCGISLSYTVKQMLTSRPSTDSQMYRYCAPKLVRTCLCCVPCTICTWIAALAAISGWSVFKSVCEMKHLFQRGRKSSECSKLDFANSTNFVH